jgi:hypothetical protein
LSLQHTTTTATTTTLRIMQPSASIQENDKSRNEDRDEIDEDWEDAGSEMDEEAGATDIPERLPHQLAGENIEIRLDPITKERWPETYIPPSLNNACEDNFVPLETQHSRHNAKSSLPSHHDLNSPLA